MWHTQGDTISTLINSEPPSRPRLHSLTIKKNIQSVLKAFHSNKKWYGRYSAQVATLIALLSAIVIQAESGYSYTATTRPFTPDEQFRIAVAVNPIMALSDLQITADHIVGQIPTSQKTMPEPPKVTTHVVSSGETLSGIAEKYNLHSGSIVLANPELENTEMIHLGDTLTIPTEDAPSEELAKEFKERSKRFASVAFAAPASNTGNVATKTLTSKTTSTGYTVPIHYGMISQGFSASHPGIDYTAPPGTPIIATRSGCVDSANKGWNGGYGQVLQLNHGDGTSSLYAHLSSFAVGRGACVKAGQVIARSGNTGRSTGPHLHFEIRKNDIQVNPLKYVR